MVLPHLGGSEYSYNINQERPVWKMYRRMITVTQMLDLSAFYFSTSITNCKQISYSLLPSSHSRRNIYPSSACVSKPHTKTPLLQTSASETSCAKISTPYTPSLLQNMPANSRRMVSIYFSKSKRLALDVCGFPGSLVPRSYHNCFT